MIFRSSAIAEEIDYSDLEAAYSRQGGIRYSPKKKLQFVSGNVKQRKRNQRECPKRGASACFLWYPPATLRERKDRMSMYSGLEVRVPFCDHRIVEYAYNMPWSLKALHGREKGIVRTAFAEELPPEIVDRKKSPYPKTFHPLYTQLTASYVRQIFKDENSIASSLFNHEAVEALMEQPESLTEPWYGQLMRTPQIFAYIIQLDRWFKKYGVTLQ